MNEKKKGLFKRLLSNEYESEASDADVRRWLSEPDERGRPMRPTMPGQFDYQRSDARHEPVTRHEQSYRHPADPEGAGPRGMASDPGRGVPASLPPEPAEPFHYEPILPAPDGVEGPPKHQASWATPFFQSIPATPQRPEPNWGRPKPPSYAKPSASSHGRPGPSSYSRPVPGFDGPRPSFDRPGPSSYARPEPSYARPEPSYERPAAPRWDDGPDDDGGVVIVDLPHGSPLEAAGIRVGDVITACNGRPTPTEDDLAGVFMALRPGQVARLTVERAGQELMAEVVVPS